MLLHRLHHHLSWRLTFLFPHIPTSSSSSPSPPRLLATAASQWVGLSAWRASPLNHNRSWGAHEPAAPGLRPAAGSWEIDHPSKCLAEWGALVLGTADPLGKAAITHHAFQLWHGGAMSVGVAAAPAFPARPEKPELVHPRKVPHPKTSGLPPNVHLLHNLAHIELNAIDLAWDTVVRFSYASTQLGIQFFADFAHVADDESRHFCWCLQRLSELGFRYGDMAAHNLLWHDCNKTSELVDARLAVIPMVQEARGLDAGPRLVERLIGLDDNRTAEIVQRISEEEIAHVAVGVSWFYSVCNQQGYEPSLRFKELMQSNGVNLKGPFNHAARTIAGIPRDWYDASLQGDLVVDGTSHSKQKFFHKIPSEVHERLAHIIASESNSSDL